MSKRKLFILFSAMQAAYWCVVGAVYSMMTTYFNALGHSPKLIGIWLLGCCLGFFAGGFLLGPISDKIGSQRKVFLISIFATVTLSIALVLTGKYAWSGVFYVLMGMTVSPGASVMDTWILRSFPDNPGYYGPIRGIGSAGVAVMFLFYGKVLENVGFWMMIPFCLFFAVLLLTTVFLVPEPPEGARVEPANVQSADREEKRKLDLRPLLKDSSFLMTLAFLFFVGLAHNPMYQYTPHIMESVGGTVAHTTLALSLNAFLQVPTMVLSAKFERFTTRQLLLGTVTVYIVCMVAMVLSRSFIVSILAFAVYGAGYGILLPTMRRTLTENSPKELRTTAQSLGDAAFGSVTGMIVSVSGGFIISAWGVHVLIDIAALFLVPALVLAFLIGRKKKTVH